MNHCILAKFKPEIAKEQKEAMYPEIKALFDNTTSIDGIHEVKLLTNCIARENRYDIMIVISMEPEALPAYDVCSWHKEWKSVYGDLLEKKAIFDYES